MERLSEVTTASRLSVGVEKGIRHDEALTAKREEPIHPQLRKGGDASHAPTPSTPTGQAQAHTCENNTPSFRSEDHRGQQT